MNTIYVIGIGFKTLNKKEREIIYNSAFILSSSRLLEIFKRYKEFKKVRDRVRVIDNVDDTINFIKEDMKRHEEETSYSKSRNRKSEVGTIVILASGDPLFFGIGRRVISEFGKERVEIIPDLSSIQIAFSRIKEPWDDALLVSIHRGPDPEKRRYLKYEIKDIPALLEKQRKIAILTDRENNPSEIAKILISSSIFIGKQPTMFICERLGYPDEKIIKGTPEDIVNRSFLSPNVAIILFGD
jgi:precorrin-6Y C5,15-methyltransferase (decarboxylating)